jgi:hypothetical protein
MHFWHKKANLGVPIRFYWKKGNMPWYGRIFSIEKRLKILLNLGGVCGFIGIFIVFLIKIYDQPWGYCIFFDKNGF